MVELSAMLTRCRGRMHPDVLRALAAFVLVVVVVVAVALWLLLNYLTLD